MHGEVIDLDPQGEPHYYIRGHVSAEAAAEAIADWWEEQCEAPFPGIGPIAHGWARWRPAQEGDIGIEDHHTHVWQTRGTPAPGWARVTEVWDLGEWRRREEERAVEYAARQMVRRKWPRAQIVWVSGRTWARREDARVDFRLGGLDVKWWPWRRGKNMSIQPAPGDQWVSEVALLTRWAEVSA
jgi:hypothetical protein